MKKKKNRFWLFVFSLWPGAGHMYIGFMKMGLSFMTGFLLSCAVVGITNIGALAVFPIIIYVYAFFHANNLGSLDDEQFAAMEDEYLFGFANMDYSRLKLNRKNRNLAAVVLIILGVCMLWNVGFSMLWEYVGWDNPVVKVIYYTVRDELPRAVLALAVIWIGVRMLRGKSEIAETGANGREPSAEQGAERHVMQIEQRKEQAESGQKDDRQQDEQADEQQNGQQDGERAGQQDGQADEQREA